MAKKQTEEIKDIVIDDITEVLDEEKEAWIHPDIEGISEDFKVKIRFVSPDRVEEIRNKSMKPVFDRNTGQKTFQIDIKKFYERILKEVVRDWESLTIKDLIHLIPVKKEALQKYPENAEIKFNEKNLKMLAEFSNTFVMWIMAVINDVDILNLSDEELEGN